MPPVVVEMYARIDFSIITAQLADIELKLAAIYQKSTGKRIQ